MVNPMASIDIHSTHSTLRERIVEHVFVGEALRALWRRGITDVEVLRSEFDAHGYDLVMGRGQIVRHIQFKTGVRNKPSPVSVGSALAEKPSGCVIWISVTLELDMGPFWWFGGEPGEPLPDLSDFASPSASAETSKVSGPCGQTIEWCLLDTSDASRLSTPCWRRCSGRYRLGRRRSLSKTAKARSTRTTGCRVRRCDQADRGSDLRESYTTRQAGPADRDLRSYLRDYPASPAGGQADLVIPVAYCASELLRLSDRTPDWRAI